MRIGYLILLWGLLAAGAARAQSQPQQQPQPPQPAPAPGASNMPAVDNLGGTDTHGNAYQLGHGYTRMPKPSPNPQQ